MCRDLCLSGLLFQPQTDTTSPSKAWRPQPVITKRSDTNTTIAALGPDGGLELNNIRKTTVLQYLGAVRFPAPIPTATYSLWEGDNVMAAWASASWYIPWPTEQSRGFVWKPRAESLKGFGGTLLQTFAHVFTHTLLLFFKVQPTLQPKDQLLSLSG